MSAKAIREFDGKHLLTHFLTKSPLSHGVVCSSDSTSSFALPNAPMASIVVLPQPHQSLLGCLQEVFTKAESIHPWLLTQKLVVKPDMLIKRRGKAGLIGINLNWDQVKKWISEKVDQPCKVEHVTGVLTHFLVEKYIPHEPISEHYLCIQSTRQGDLIYYSTRGGVDVGHVEDHARQVLVEVLNPFPMDTLLKQLTIDIPNPLHRTWIAEWIVHFYAVFVDLQFTYLEINPWCVMTHSKEIYVLDLAAKLDQTAEFECGMKWSNGLMGVLEYSTLPNKGNLSIEFPAPFGREFSKEEKYIAELDAKTGASLKLTVLNPKGRIWTMVAGGGASVVYSDAIAAIGYAHELANYGEYSGAPSETQTYEYAKCILDLMTRDMPRSDGKILLIGGGIANFTNVASTFKGISRALTEYQKLLQSHHVQIFVRRAGPNWQEGLQLIRQLSNQLNLSIKVFGPETHITAIVPLALKGEMSTMEESTSLETKKAFLVQTARPEPKSSVYFPTPAESASSSTTTTTTSTTSKVQTVSNSPPFTNQTRAFVFGMQPRAVQGMLDFDYICKRTVPSVAAMIYPFGGSHVQKFYWGTQETMVPVYQNIAQAVEKHPDVDTVVNFASCRSVFETTVALLVHPQLKTIAIIAEGVPELRARLLLHMAKQKGVLIIGPATVGGIKSGCFKIGNTGGMMDNIVASKLYRPGSVAYVSKSGGMSNELNNIISRTTDGVYEGVAIGGDRYPGSTFIDHLLRFEEDPNVKILLLLGEVGGVEEYEIAKAIESKSIKKPVLAWCIGTCAKLFQTEVQFGHAGALANSDRETADAKNQALKIAGALVPDSFEALPELLREIYQSLVDQGVIVPKPEPEVPKVPIDYSWAQELGLIRKPASFVSTICDDRGQELLYAGMPISDVFKQNIGIGGVVSLLWFKRRLPDYACKFIEMVLMLTADHGPAVSGAHNTIVTARAGKDLVSSICSGLLTIGERFGGALDGAAEQFSNAYDKNMTPREFVDSMRKQNTLILGIGHKIKSRSNPDLRVELIKEYAKKNFRTTPILDFALAVEEITTSKKDNLILNVDGAIGVLFVDLLRHCGAFTREEADEVLKIGTLNGLFVLGRSIGFIGHFLDQKRLKQGLYRHPWDDISYLVGAQNESQRILATSINPL
ncbi:citrate synthase [Coelomomyces lativittatus]|nr:citrate synthase [Coelomomyces lativittatus]